MALESERSDEYALPRVSVYSLDGRLLAKLLDNGQGDGQDQLMAPHGMAVDSDGNIYVAEVSWTISRMFNRGEPLTHRARKLMV